MTWQKAKDMRGPHATYVPAKTTIKITMNYELF